MIEEEAAAFVRLRIGDCETLGKGFEFSGCLRARDAGIQTSDDREPVLIACVAAGNAGSELLNVSEGNPKLGIENEIEAVEAAGSDAYNGIGLAGKADGFADDSGIGGETMLPEALAKDNDGEILFVGAEAAAEGHTEATDVEIVGGGGLSPDALGLAIAADGGGDEFIVGGDAGEGFGVVADVGVGGMGEIVAALVAVVGGVESEERGGIADGSEAENEAADYGEDRGVGGDAEADGEHDGEDEAGGFGKATKGVG